MKLTGLQVFLQFLSEKTGCPNGSDIQRGNHHRNNREIFSGILSAENSQASKQGHASLSFRQKGSYLIRPEYNESKTSCHQFAEYKDCLCEILIRHAVRGHLEIHFHPACGIKCVSYDDRVIGKGDVFHLYPFHPISKQDLPDLAGYQETNINDL